jgi:hypothetical protein
MERIFGPEMMQQMDKNIFIMESHNLHFIPDIVRTIKSKKFKCAG